jgi:hypothetical protein
MPLQIEKTTGSKREGRSLKAAIKIRLRATKTSYTLVRGIDSTNVENITLDA